MSRSRPWKDANPDLRRQTQLPAVPIEQIEKRLYQLLSPASFKPLRHGVGKKQQRLRERILTLPVMMAVVLSLVYRRIPSLSELLRVLKVEGLLWIEPISVSKQALCKRLRELPASLFACVFEQVMDRIRSAYLWVGDTNGVQIQIFATWIFYAVLNQLCTEVAVALSQPKERISYEMVFRGLYHFSRALLRGENTDVVSYLVAHHQILGRVLATRKRHRENSERSAMIWVQRSLS